MAKPKLPAGLQWREGTIHTDFSWEGRRIRESLKTSDPKLAEVMLGELKSSLFRGTYVPSSKGSVGGRLTVSKAFDLAVEGAWLAGARPATVKSAHHHFSRLTVRRGGLPAHLPASTAVQDLDKRSLFALQRALLSEGLSPGTVNLRLWVVRGLLEAARDEGALERLPEMPKNLDTRSRVRQRYLTPQEESLVLQYLATDDRYLDLRDLWVLMLDTGMRVNEVSSLEVRDVDRRQRMLTVRPELDKAKRGRKVPMTERVQGIVARRCEVAVKGRLFPPATQHPRYWPQRFHDLWSEARKALDLPDVVLHTGRHTTGTRLFEAGMDLRTAMEYLGHSTPEMTLNYAKAVGEKMHAAARALETLSQSQGTPRESAPQEPHNRPQSQS